MERPLPLSGKSVSLRNMLSENVRSEIQSITSQLVEQYHAQKVILFGSAANGHFHEDSDLDFLIIKDNIPTYGKDRLRELDSLIYYRVPVDMIVYNAQEMKDLQAMNDPFVMQILREGIVLHDG